PSPQSIRILLPLYLAINDISLRCGRGIIPPHPSKQSSSITFLSFLSLFYRCLCSISLSEIPVCGRRVFSAPAGRQVFSGLTAGRLFPRSAADSRQSHSSSVCSFFSTGRQKRCVS